MHRYLVFLLLFLTIGAPVEGQVLPDSSPTSRLLLKFAPLSLLDPYTSVLQVGLEYRPVREVGLSLDYGLRFSTVPSTRHAPEDNMRYFRLRSEVRYYLPVHERRATFPAVEAFYVPRSQDTQNRAYYRDNTLFAYDQAHLDQQVWGVCLKYGLMQRLGNRWWLEGSTGLGVRWVTSRYSNVQNEQPVPLADAYKYERGWGFVPGLPDPGRETKLHMALNFKVGYTLISR